MCLHADVDRFGFSVGSCETREAIRGSAYVSRAKALFWPSSRKGEASCLFWILYWFAVTVAFAWMSKLVSGRGRERRWTARRFQKGCISSSERAQLARARRAAECIDRVARWKCWRWSRYVNGTWDRRKSGFRGVITDMATDCIRLYGCETVCTDRGRSNHRILMARIAPISRRRRDATGLKDVRSPDY